MFKKVLLLIVVFTVPQIYSLPRFALKTGGMCADCHANPTGGLLRNESGFSYGKNALKMWNSYKEGEELEISPAIGKNISYGFDFRTQYLAKFDSAKSKSDFQNMTGSMYFGTTLSEKMEVAARYDFVWGVWEAYAVAKVLPFNGYLKAGTFQPNFGVRIDDHTAYTRGGDMGKITSAQNGFPYNALYNETGVEAGFTFGDFAFFTVSAGKSNVNSLFKYDPAYTTNLMLTPVQNDNFNLMVGGSYAAMKKTNNNDGTKLNANLAGAYVGIGFNDFTLLAEFDNAVNYNEKDSSMSAMMIEASYKISKGLDAIIRLDSFSGDDPMTTDGAELKLQHLIIGAEWFPYSFIEIRPQYRVNTEKPDIKNNAFVMQFHFFY